MKILFLQKRILFPVDAGWKIRTLNVLKHLAAWHEITYLCNVQQADRPYLEQMRELGMRLETVPWRETPRSSPRFYWDLAQSLLSQDPFTAWKDHDPALRRRAEQLLEEGDYDLVICDFVQMARNAMGLPSRASLLFQHNVEAQIYERHARNASGWLKRRFMGLQWKKMRRFESEAGKDFDAVVAVSDADREHFANEYGWAHAHTIDTAVDTHYFHPNGNAEESNRVLFLGSLDWLPNEDGVRFFIEKIWPAVRQRRPHASFQIVGRNPSRNVQRFASAPGVELIGTVPDVRPYLASAAVVVVPLLVGGGTRIKIFEAMAMRKAVVSTSLGAEGLPVRSGEHLVLCDDANAFAESVVSLLENDNHRHAIAENAVQMVRQKYGAETVARQFESICQEAIRG
ncbi:MAG: glycosyltransferase [Planctomycetales bacterium]|nr:glycosyltransferase [Planctomycetales bacterium]